MKKKQLEKLVRRIQQSDEQAVETFYQFQKAKLRAFIRSKVSREDEDDIFQDAFWATIKQFKKQKEHTNPNGLMKEITRNRICDHFRAQKDTTQLEEEHLDPVPFKDQRRLELYEAMTCSGLTHMEKDILIKRFFHGFTFKEIQDIYAVECHDKPNIKPLELTTIRYHEQKAYKKIRTFLSRKELPK